MAEPAQAAAGRADNLGSTSACLSLHMFVTHRLARRAGLRLRRVHRSRRQHRVVLHALPFEMATIGGAALGAFVVNNQLKVLKATAKGLVQCFKGSKYTKARYMELMALLYDILQKARKEGLMSIEKDVEDPHESPLFQKYPTRRQRPPRDRVHHRLPAHDGLGQPERARDREPDGQRDRDPPPRSACAGRRAAAPGRRPAGLRHRRRGARRGQHDGLGRPAAGRCWAA